MKQAWLIAAAILLTAATPFRVRQLLDSAIENERSAAVRYESFAAKAAEEGNLGAASLFRAAARAEHVHANRLEKAARERGLDVPGVRESNATPGSTTDNIRAASAAEIGERDGFYREAIVAATDAKDAALAKIFDQSRDTEVEHANLLSALLRDSKLLTTAKTYYVCGECGYTTDISLPMCALCRARGTTEPIE